MYMPVPAIAQAMSAPNGPVAVANRPGRLKMPAPTIEPMTIAVKEESGSFPSAGEATEDAEGAVEDVMSPPSYRCLEGNRAERSLLSSRAYLPWLRKSTQIEHGERESFSPRQGPQVCLCSAKLGRTATRRWENSAMSETVEPASADNGAGDERLPHVSTEKRKRGFPAPVTILTCVLVLVWIASFFIPSGQYTHDPSGSPIAGSFRYVESPLDFKGRIED